MVPKPGVAIGHHWGWIQTDTQSQIIKTLLVWPSDWLRQNEMNHRVGSATAMHPKRLRGLCKDLARGEQKWGKYSMAAVYPQGPISAGVEAIIGLSASSISWLICSSLLVWLTLFFFFALEPVIRTQYFSHPRHVLNHWGTALGPLNFEGRRTEEIKAHNSFYVSLVVEHRASRFNAEKNLTHPLNSKLLIPERQKTSLNYSVGLVGFRNL